MPSRRRRRPELLSLLRQMSELREKVKEKENEIGDISANLATVRELKRKLDSAENRASQELQSIKLSMMAIKSALLMKPVLYVTDESELNVVSYLQIFSGLSKPVKVVAKNREEQGTLESRARHLGLTIE